MEPRRYRTVAALAVPRVPHERVAAPQRGTDRTARTTLRAWPTSSSSTPPALCASTAGRPRPHQTGSTKTTTPGTGTVPTPRPWTASYPTTHKGLHDHLEDTVTLEWAGNFAGSTTTRIQSESTMAGCRPSLLDNGRHRLPRPCRTRPRRVRPDQPDPGRVRRPRLHLDLLAAAVRRDWAP